MQATLKFNTQGGTMTPKNENIAVLTMCLLDVQDAINSMQRAELHAARAKDWSLHHCIKDKKIDIDLVRKGVEAAIREAYDEQA